MVPQELGVLIGLIVWLSIITFICWAEIHYEKIVKSDKNLALNYSVLVIIFLLVGAGFIFLLIEDYYGGQSRHTRGHYFTVLFLLLLPLIINCLLLSVGILLLSFSPHLVNLAIVASEERCSRLQKCCTIWSQIGCAVKTGTALGLVTIFMATIVDFFMNIGSLRSKENLLVIFIIETVIYCMTFLPIDRSSNFFAKLRSGFPYDANNEANNNHDNNLAYNETIIHGGGVRDFNSRLAERTQVLGYHPYPTRANFFPDMIHVETEKNLKPPPSYLEALTKGSLPPPTRRQSGRKFSSDSNCTSIETEPPSYKELD